MSKMMLDQAGRAYLGWFTGWQVAFFGALGYLWLNRQLPTVRMRKLPVLTVGIFLLHSYATLCLMAYPAAAYFSCTNIFWLMSILLPCGIAIFHAANSQFLHLASRQKQFARTSTLKDHKPIDEEKARAVANSRWQRIISGRERADNINRTLFFIGAGMVLQLALTLFVYFGSAKFHPSYGLFDYTVQGTEQEQALRCHTGWEWWLSIVWQFVWAWIYAPYMLWKSRGVRDVHSWRLQTICCCIVGLPATPLWLASLYLPQFGPVNMVFPPPVWFSLFIFFMEVFTLGFPIYEISRSNTLRHETLEAIANWEKRQAMNDDNTDHGDHGSMRSTTTLAATAKSAGETTLMSDYSIESQRSNMLTMTALENALRTNAIPLLEFAALKDFSGENVSFLTHIADWRRYWFSPRLSTAEHRKQQFITAVRIYSHFISLEFSEFPINISSKEMKRLHQVFESAAVLLNRRNRGSIDSDTSDSSATPFDNMDPRCLPDSPTIPGSPGFLRSPVPALFPPSPIKAEFEMKATDLDSLGRANLRASSRMRRNSMEDLFANVQVPEAFRETIFDQAESEIKYLVLTNTWPKFVNAGRTNSQLGRDVDQEAGGHKWMRKFLC